MFFPHKQAMGNTGGGVSYGQPGYGGGGFGGAGGGGGIFDMLIFRKCRLPNIL